MRKILFLMVLLCAPVLARAAYDDEPEPSTAPIGSSFYRHLAFQMNLDLKELEKFEKRGFGRSEIITLIFISHSTGVPLKDYGKRRLKDKVSLRDLAAEAKMDYDTLEKNVRTVKEAIEAQGDTLLPQPVFEVNTVETEEKEKSKKKDKEKKEDKATSSPAPEAKPTPSPTSTTPAAPPRNPSQTELE